MGLVRWGQRSFPFVFFCLSFFVFLRFSSFSLALLEDKGKRLQFAAKMGNFTPTPSASTPCKTSPIVNDWFEGKATLSNLCTIVYNSSHLWSFRPQM